MIENILVSSTDKDYKIVYTKEVAPITYKLVELNNFSIYLNNFEDPEKDFITNMVNKLSIEEISNFLQKLVKKIINKVI
jgi:hypothetical protein